MSRRITIIRRRIDSLPIAIEVADVLAEQADSLTLRWGSPTHERLLSYHRANAPANARRRPKLANIARPEQPSADFVPSITGWREGHALAQRPVHNVYGTLAAIYGMTLRLGRHNAHRQWRDMLSSDPVDLADLPAWFSRQHNKTNRHIGRPAWPVSRKPFRFAYFTGSTRPDEGPRIAAMIRSARRAGVAENFHVFAVEQVLGAINHRIAAGRSWKNHMAKVELLSELAAATGEQYDAYVWLDSDNWFVRDPGDMTMMLRDNPIWVGMESDLRESVQADWYGMRIKESPSVFDLLDGAGCRPDWMHGVNGGMWIVRREAVAEFHAKMFAASDYFGRRGYPHATNDEPPLAVLGSSMVKDPGANTIEKWSHVWACDWAGRWHERLPDGSPWAYKDWGTQQDMGKINPAIIHNMRGKHLMIEKNEPVPSERSIAMKS